MTLQEIKDNYAKEQGYLFWNHFLKNAEWEKILISFDELCILSQQQALNNASESAKLEYVDGKIVALDKKSILSENN